MNMLLHFHIVAVLLVLLAIVNLFVPGRFHWREELSRVSLLNRQIFIVHDIFIILIILMFAALLFFCGASLLDHTVLARAILVGLSVFWMTRMLFQWFFYSPKIWRGNRFNTTMHIVFSAMWVYFTATFACALYMNIAM
jgi:hypothetical protein